MGAKCSKKDPGKERHHEVHDEVPVSKALRLSMVSDQRSFPDQTGRARLGNPNTVQEQHDAIKNMEKRLKAAANLNYYEIYAPYIEYAKVLASHKDYKALTQLDPRKLVSRFFEGGTVHGPTGFLQETGAVKKGGAPAKYFVVFRPTSMTSFRLMIRGNACGKGLNIKGKSAKRSVVSGLVPFLQISVDEDKYRVEESPKDARIRVYFAAENLRDNAKKHAEDVRNDMEEGFKVAQKLQLELEKGLVFHKMSPEEEKEHERKLKWEMEDPQIIDVEYNGGAFGLDMPERLFMETWVMRQNISPAYEWETGRASEPFSQNMNLHATRDGAAHKVRTPDDQKKTTPTPVVWQFDDRWEMNPRGLVLAYEETYVLPVASDMDGFCFGSKGMKIESVPSEQVELLGWTLDVIDELLSGHHKSWMGAWIQVLQREAEKGFHPHIPKWGFGDPKTSEVTVALAGALSVSGAVRHGAECFNFFFPQDLDDEYLIIWDGFTHLNWKNVGPGALRKFLVERANEGYVFPINPKWVIADGWHEVWAAMMNHKEGAEAMKKWYPPETCNILERIEGLKKKYPEGFKPV